MIPGSTTLPARGRCGEGHIGFCWGTSPSPGPGQVPICHGRPVLEAGLTNLVGGSGDKEARGDVMSAPGRNVSAVPFPGWHMKLFASRRALCKGIPGLTLGLWGPQQGRPCFHLSHLRISSHSTGEIKGCASLPSCPFGSSAPSSTSLPSSLWPFLKHLLGWGAHSLSRPLPHLGSESTSSSGTNVCLCQLPPAGPGSHRLYPLPLPHLKQPFGDSKPASGCLPEYGVNPGPLPPGARLVLWLHYPLYQRKLGVLLGFTQMVSRAGQGKEEPRWACGGQQG